MADNDQINDEYQFADMDAISPDDGYENEKASTTGESTSEGTQIGAEKNNTNRNAVIVVVMIIVALVLYKLVSSLFSEKKPLATISAPTVKAVTQRPVQPLVAPPQLASNLPLVASPAPNVDGKIDQKLSALELSQQSMRTDVSSVSNQLGGISNNMTAVVAKMTELTTIITNLTAKVDAQSHEIEQLTIHREAKKAHYAVRGQGTRYPKFYLQAVIPGRAWLIATNGTTLTVREGTIIAGYGMVKLIDPNQGRVLTSTGQVIRFSQEDS